jgi:SH3 domain protein
MGDLNSRLVVALVLLWGTLLGSKVAMAESLYITDKISIDVHSEKFAKGEHIKSLPTGTIVEVLARDQGYSQIRTRDDLEGWVEFKYLSNEKPMQIEFLQLTAKYKAAQDKINDYQTRLLEMQELRKEAQTVDWLRSKLKENETTETTLEQNLKLKDISIAELKITVANLEEQLANTQQQLDETLRNLQAASSTYPLDAEGISQPLYSTSSSVSFYTWLVLSLAVTLIIGILMGFVLIDYKVRKKHSEEALY